MFDAWGPWAWVAAAWAQLAVAYGGYVIYLGLRRRRLDREEDRP